MQWGLPVLSSPERVAPTLPLQGLALKLVNLVPPHMPLARFTLLSLCWSFEQRVCEQVSLCVCGLFNAWSTAVSAALCFSGTQSLVFITARCYGESFSRHRWHWLRILVWGWDHFLGGTSTAEISLPFLHRHTVGVGLAHTTSPPLPTSLTVASLYPHRNPVQLFLSGSQ